jgi:hypothetical protein
MSEVFPLADNAARFPDPAAGNGINESIKTPMAPEVKATRACFSPKFSQFPNWVLCFSPSMKKNKTPSRRKALLSQIETDYLIFR